MPPVRVVVLVLHLLNALDRVVDRRLQPHLTGPEIDSAAAMNRVPLEHHRQFLDDGQGPQWRKRRCPLGCLQHVRQFFIACPAARPQRGFACVGQGRRAVDMLTRGGEQAVADQLQRVCRPQSTRQELDDVRAV
jgi:hypothetical protein